MFGRDAASLRRIEARVTLLNERMKFMAIDLLALSDAVNRAVDTMQAAAAKLDAAAAAVEQTTVDPVALQAFADSLNVAAEALSAKVK